MKHARFVTEFSAINSSLKGNKLMAPMQQHYLSLVQLALKTLSSPPHGGSVGASRLLVWIHTILMIVGSSKEPLEKMRTSLRTMIENLGSKMN